VGEQGLRCKPVVDHRIRPPQTLDALDGKEARVAGAASDQVDHLLLTSGSPRAPPRLRQEVPRKSLSNLSGLLALRSPG
jgi:hypothetical protein